MNTANEPQSEPQKTQSAIFMTALKSLRDRSREMLRLQTSRLRDLESKLESQLVAAVERLEQEPREIDQEEQALFDRASSLEREIKRLQQLQMESDQALEEARLMLSELEEERRILRERLDQTTNAAESSSNDDRTVEDTERLSRRLEMAMQEIRELKSQNADLAEQLKQSSSPSTPVASSTVSSGFSWESQKQRLLEQLASGFDANDKVQAKEKLRIEEVIRTTDATIADKDRQIAAIQNKLDELQSQPIPKSTEDAAVEQLLASDEVIQAEREKLATIQAEWQEKLRQAEVEISIERAKLARERLQMEEKLRASAQKASESIVPAAGEPKTPGRGRWLSRLGLADDGKG